MPYKDPTKPLVVHILNQKHYVRMQKATDREMDTEDFVRILDNIIESLKDLNRVAKQAWDVGYNSGYRKATIDHLGGVCMKEGCNITAPSGLEIHHLEGIGKRGRDRRHWKNIKDLELWCKGHHPK